MESYSFQNLYFEHIHYLYNAEKQISESFPKLIEVISSADLRETFYRYLQCVKNHIQTLDQVYGNLKINPVIEPYATINGIFEMSSKAIQHSGNSSVKDAALISFAQCLMHLKMALYGSTRTFASHLDYTKEVDLLQKALDEEGEFDKALTKLAEGGLFSTGINEQACKELSYASIEGGPVGGSQ